MPKIKRIGDRIGVKSETLNGLSGLGDLVGTAFSSHSRNRLVGELIGRGVPLSEIVQDLGMVAEGIETSKSIHRLIEKVNVDAPICRKVYEVVHKNKNPNRAILELMTRSVKNTE